MSSASRLRKDPESLRPGHAPTTAAIQGFESITDEARAAAVQLPEVTVFEHADFQGDSWRTTFGYQYVGYDWQDKISSIIVHSGYFQFFEDRDFGSPNWGPVLLGPGHYRWVADVGIHNDSITSWKAFYG